MKKLLDLLRSQVGYSEHAGGYTKFGHWYNTIESDTDYSTEPWCDMFLSWGANKLGYQDWFGQFAYTVGHARWFKEQGAWGHHPVPGAVVFFDWSGSGTIDGIDHVGIVTKVDGDRIHTIEGNVDGEYVEKKVRDSSSIVGYGYPEEIKARLAENAAPATAAEPAAPTLKAASHALSSHAVSSRSLAASSAAGMRAAVAGKAANGSLMDGTPSDSSPSDSSPSDSSPSDSSPSDGSPSTGSPSDSVPTNVSPSDDSPTPAVSQAAAETPAMAVSSDGTSGTGGPEPTDSPAASPAKTPSPTSTDPGPATSPASGAKALAKTLVKPWTGRTAKTAAKPGAKAKPKAKPKAGTAEKPTPSLSALHVASFQHVGHAGLELGAPTLLTPLVVAVLAFAYVKIRRSSVRLAANGGDLQQSSLGGAGGSRTRGHDATAQSTRVQWSTSLLPSGTTSPSGGTVPPPWPQPPADRSGTAALTGQMTDGGTPPERGDLGRDRLRPTDLYRGTGLADALEASWNAARDPDEPTARPDAYFLHDSSQAHLPHINQHEHSAQQDEPNDRHEQPSGSASFYPYQRPDADDLPRGTRHREGSPDTPPSTAPKGRGGRHRKR
ncbi:CHAP domain-containing protein [Planotetraspora sp. GP83]|uniref:CHAP domain-containing protein n=1 Tax=Planotetraspora sp. GP83 TaxID=3156264 RepID=UPI003512A8B2